MGTYDTRGGSALAPDDQDETCDGCGRDASDCQCIAFERVEYSADAYLPQHMRDALKGAVSFEEAFARGWNAAIEAAATAPKDTGIPRDEDAERNEPKSDDLRIADMNVASASAQGMLGAKAHRKSVNRGRK
jgi:hypothetical protein